MQCLPAITLSRSHVAETLHGDVRESGRKAARASFVAAEFSGRCGARASSRVARRGVSKATRGGLLSTTEHSRQPAVDFFPTG